MAELADAWDLKSQGRKAVRVRFPAPARRIFSNFGRSRRAGAGQPRGISPNSSYSLAVPALRASGSLEATDLRSSFRLTLHPLRAGPRVESFGSLSVHGLIDDRVAAIDALGLMADHRHRRRAWHPRPFRAANRGPSKSCNSTLGCPAASQAAAQRFRKSLIGDPPAWVVAAWLQTRPQTLRRRLR